MRALDRLLQRWRILKTQPFVPMQARVLDVGCADAALFKVIGPRISGGVGIDPDAVPEEGANFRLIRGRFPEDLPESGGFDTVTVLAVLEHIPEEAQPRFAAACHERLRPGGHLVITVPHPAVDRIIDVLKRVRVLDGMADEEHYGFNPDHTIKTFEDAGFVCVRRRRFQLGLNNLFAFQRPRVSPAAQAPAS